MKTIKELNEDINAKSSYNYLKQLKGLFYDIKKCLINRTDENIELISDFIDESIDDYFENELNEAIEKAKNAVINGEYEYDEFFEPPIEPSDYLRSPYEDEIALEFCADTRDNTTDNEALQRFINYFYDGEISDLGNVKDYEIMAVMALKHIQAALENSDEKYQKEEMDSMVKDLDLVDDFIYMAKEQAIKDSINACLAVNESLSMKHSEELYLKLNQKNLELEKTVLSNRASKGGKARHKRSNEIKKTVIDEYRQEEKRYQQQGKTLSKNDFSRRVSIKYGLNETTVRKNWLQGI